MSAAMSAYSIAVVPRSSDNGRESPREATHVTPPVLTGASIAAGALNGFVTIR